MKSVQVKIGVIVSIGKRKVNPISKEFERIVFDILKVRATQQVSEETQNLINRGNLKILDSVIKKIIYDLETYVHGKQIGQHIETAQVTLPETWWDHFLIETRVGKVVRRIFKLTVTYKTHVLETTTIYSVVFPGWVHTMPESFGRAVLDARYSSKLTEL